LQERPTATANEPRDAFIYLYNRVFASQWDDITRYANSKDVTMNRKLFSTNVMDTVKKSVRIILILNCQAALLRNGERRL